MLYHVIPSEDLSTYFPIVTKNLSDQQCETLSSIVIQHFTSMRKEQYRGFLIKAGLDDGGNGFYSYEAMFTRQTLGKRYTQGEYLSPLLWRYIPPFSYCT